MLLLLLLSTLIISSCKQEEIIRESYSNGNPKVIVRLKNDSIIWKRTYHFNNLRHQEGNIANLSFQGPYSEWDSFGTLTATGFMKEGLKDSLWQFWYKKKILKAQGPFKSNLRHGEWQTFYPTGTLKAKQIFSLGILSGPSKQFYPSGQIEIENNCFQSNGYYKEFYRNGNLKQNYQCLGLSKNGDYQRFDLLNHLMEKGDYKQNLKNGIWFQYYASGNVLYQKEWLLGKRHGTWIKKSSNGSILYQAHFEKGNGHIQIPCPESTIVCQDSLWVNNSLHGLITTTQNKKVKEIENWVNGNKIWSKEYYWYENKWILISKTPYLNSKKHGLYQRWDQYKRIRQSCEYVNGEKKGIELFFDKTGKATQKRKHLGGKLGMIISR